MTNIRCCADGVCTMPSGHWHGTVNGYVNYRCHCQPCKDAHAANHLRYGRAYRVRLADAGLTTNSSFAKPVTRTRPFVPYRAKAGTRLDDAEIARLYLSGMSCPEIAAIDGREASAIVRSLRRTGTPRRPPGSHFLTPEQRAEALVQLDELLAGRRPGQL